MNLPNKTSKAWRIQFNHYDPADEGRRETLLAIGNGFIVSRAAAPESQDDTIHYPGTYRVGCYNQLKSHIQGQEVENESLVNLPDWLPLTFRIEGGHWFSLEEVEILNYEQVLDMRQAILYRKVHFRDHQGRQIWLQEKRFVSMAQPHLLALSMELRAENWSGELEICSGLDGRITNHMVERYAPYNNRHLDILNTCQWGEEGTEIQAQTNHSHINIALAARTHLSVVGRKPSQKREIETKADSISDRRYIPIQAGEQVMIEKIAALYTSPEADISECSKSAREVLAQASDVDTLVTAHKNAWEKLWQRCQIESNLTDQVYYFRLHSYHILQNLSPHTAQLDAGVPPSGWQGEEYHGQVFWDVLFVFPFLVFRFPDVARSLILYHYRRLDAARQQAKEQGYRGAMFPWRSASDGHEETPLFQLNPLSGHWMKDYTRLQRHIGAIIAYNVWQYVQTTGDVQFLTTCGAELFLEIARFWASIAHYNAAEDRFEIKGVAGPDEYHTRYPDAEKPGIHNNTYTNLMAVWTLSKAPEVFNHLSPERQQELRNSLHLREEEFDHWDRVSRRMKIVFYQHEIIGQFEGFDRLEKFDLPKFRKQHGDQRIDWKLDAMGDKVERYHVSKQADTALLLYLFTPAELIELMERLNYSVNGHILRQTLEYHLAHTAHESSLSRVVYAGALASLDLEASWKLFRESQLIDLSPEDKGTADGIHLGAMGGTWAVLQHRYLGIKIQADVLEVQPTLPKAFEWVQLTLFFHGVELDCKATHTNVAIRSVDRRAKTVKVSCGGNQAVLEPGAKLTFTYT